MRADSLLMYVIRNQNQLFLSKSGEWLSHHEVKSLFRTEFKDEAVNQKIELTVKDAELRLNVIEVEADTKGQPLIPQENEIPEHAQMASAEETALF